MSFVVVEGDVTLRSGGVELATADGVAVVAGARGFIGVGYDGTNTRFIQVNSSGQQIIVGAGTAGTPAGGVVSIQGVSGGTAVPVSQNAPPWAVKGTNADSAAVTENPVLVSGWDGINVRTLKLVLDNSIYRLESRSSIVGQAAGAGAEKKVSVIDDADAPATKRLQVESDIKPGATIQVTTGAAVASGTVASLLKDTGGAGSENMVVNGSATPVKFEFNADPTNDIQITSVRLVMSAAFFNFNGADFGKGGGALPNGLSIDIVANGGTFTGQLAILKVNEDWFRLLEFAISQAGTTDVMAASLIFGGGVFLEAGTADEISVTINDDMTSGSRGITYLTGTVYGIKVVP